MRQIALLPAGCHQCEQTIVYASDSKILFCSKLALYVINPSTFVVERIISIQSRSMRSMSVSPHNDNHVVCSGVDGAICVWNITSEECTLKFMHQGDILAWDPHDPNNCAVIVNRPKLQLFAWDMREDSCTTKRLYVADSDTFVANVARWNPHVIGQLAIGGSNGVTYIYETHSRKVKTLKVKDRATSISDLQWDRLSAVYMIVAYQAFISLWDTETASEVHVFDKQSTGISCIAWLDWTAGNFISANAKTGVIKVWNASQRAPLESVRVHSGGIQCVHFASGSSRMVCGCTDGSIVVYHMLKRQVEFATSAGHTDTIFDCSMSPVSPDTLCTCSYDSTIKIWSTDDLTLQKTLYGPESIIYSCSWSKDSTLIAGSTIGGDILIWSVESGRELVRYKYHKKASYAVKWNYALENVLLSASADGVAAVIEIDLSTLGEVSNSGGSIGSRRKKANPAQQEAQPTFIGRFEHPSAIFGCDWCPHSSHMFATGCQDGFVRVFKYKTKLAPIYVLRGHQSRAFSVSWSPLICGLLASGSDDHTVKLWEIPDVDKTGDLVNHTLSPVRSLEGHTSNVRALTWNYEHRQILISGSWDSTIRVWNASTGTCLQVVCDHVADIYTVSSHPKRPFTYVSCSRDSTLRLWEIEGFAVRMRLRCIMDGNFGNCIQSEAIEAAADEMPAGNLLSALSDELEPRICGKASKQLAAHFMIASCDSGPTLISTRKKKVHGLELALKYKSLFNFFCGANGCLNLWDCVIAYCKSQTDVGSNIVPCLHLHSAQAGVATALPEDTILATAKSDARRLESSKMGTRRGDVSGKVEENLRQAALKYAQVGDFLKYCSIMVEVGDWKAALAVAPSVSIEYWQHLMKEYAEVLRKNMSEDCIPYYLAVGQDRTVIDFHLHRNESTSAMVVAKMSEHRTDLIPDMLHGTDYSAEAIDRVVKKSPNKLSRCDTGTWAGPKNEAFRERTETEAEASRRVVREVALRSAEISVSRARPISAAAHLISIGETVACVKLLLLCGESDLAFAVCDCLDIDGSECVRMMAEKAEYLKDLELALDILQRLDYPNSEQERALRIARHASSSENREPSKNDLELSKAAEADAIGHDEEAIVAYITGNDHLSAARTGLKRLERHIGEPMQLPATVQKVLNVLRNVRAQDLNGALRMTFLSHMCWFGAHRAVKIGFWDVASGMLRILGTISQSANFPISVEKIAVQEMCIRVQSGDPCALVTVEKLVSNIESSMTSEAGVPHELVMLLRELRRLLQEFGNDPTYSFHSNYRSLSATALRTCRVYGELTAEIEEVIRRVGTLLSLPLLPSTLPNPPEGVQSVFRVPYGCNAVSGIEGLPIVVQGSLLPVANQNLKVLVSVVTGKRIQGSVVMLEDKSSFLSLNEALMWRAVNPYSPLCTGEFLHIC